MIELTDTFPDVNVQPAEYKRLLGYPRDRVLDGRAQELAERARQWYLDHGRPWVYARQAQNLQLSNGSVLIDGAKLHSKRLRGTLEQAQAHSAILVAVSAGPEAEAQANKLWLEEKPDEYFFLEIFASAVVEHLTTMTGARLCAWAETRQMAVLPRESPGYAEWDISEQLRVYELLRRAGRPSLPGSLEVMESGMLRPKKSLLTVFGLTRQTENIRKVTDLVPCENCSFSPCQFRRAPYRRASDYAMMEGMVREDVAESIEESEEKQEAKPQAAGLTKNAPYKVSTKALKKWAAERLTLTDLGDGSTQAMFKFEGSTCSNMGRTLRFDYRMVIGPRGKGYPIVEQQCSPTAGDDNYTYMCRYMNNAEHLMVAIDQEKPLNGQGLDEVLKWERPSTGASCYCEGINRKHMWGLVLETVHYAMAQREGSR